MSHTSHSESHLVRYGNPKCPTDEIVTDAARRQTDARQMPDIASTRPVGFASGKKAVRSNTNGKPFPNNLVYIKITTNVD